VPEPGAEEPDHLKPAASSSVLTEFGLLPPEELPPRLTAEVDHAVIGYHRKLAGVDPWTVFEIPPSLRRREAA